MSKAKIPSVSRERVLELLSYDSETGKFAWRLDRNQNVRAGDVAGRTHRTGYVYIRVDGQLVLAHRLAWLVAHGSWADLQIDHVDGNRANNAIRNLRVVTQSVNSQNQRRARSDNSTGLLGVTYHRSKSKYAAQINIGGRNRHLGYFADKHEAHAAYLDAKRTHHEGCVL